MTDLLLRRVSKSRADGGSRRDNDVDLSLDELGRDLGEALRTPIRPTLLDCKGAVLSPAEFAQPLHKRRDVSSPSGNRSRAKEPNGRQLLRLLRPRHNRPRGRRAPEQRDELSPLH